MGYESAAERKGVQIGMHLGIAIVRSDRWSLEVQCLRLLDDLSLHQSENLRFVYLTLVNRFT